MQIKNIFFVLLLFAPVLKAQTTLGKTLPDSNYRVQAVYNRVFMPLCMAADLPINALRFHVLKAGNSHPFYSGAWIERAANGVDLTIEQKLYDT